MANERARPAVRPVPRKHHGAIDVAPGDGLALALAAPAPQPAEGSGPEGLMTDFSSLLP
jgi:hypothetical protein